MISQPRTDRRWTRRKEERPAELMAAALDLFVERGFAATRLDDVASRAGVSKGTLYLYFSSKEELFKAVIRSGIVPLIEHGEKLHEEHRGAAGELLRKIMFGWWQSVGSSKLGGIPKLMISECRNFPEIGQFYFDEVISRSYRLIESVIETGMGSGEFRRMDANYATRLLTAPMLVMLLWRYSFDFCESKCVDAEKYLEQHLDVFISGLVDPAARKNGTQGSDIIGRNAKQGAKPAKVVNIRKKGRGR